MNVSPIQINLQDLRRKYKNDVKVLRKVLHGARLEVAEALGDLIISARNTTGPAESFAWGKLMCFASEFLKFPDKQPNNSQQVSLTTLVKR